MTENRRFAVLVLTTLGMGTGLCAAAGFLLNFILAIPMLGPVAPALAVLILLGSLALGCWLFLLLVNRLFRHTYNG